MEKQWYIHKDGVQKGPFTIDQLRQQFNSGLLGPSDMVWTEGMAQWIQAGQLKLLSAGPAVVPPHVVGSSAPPAGAGYQQPHYGHYAAPGAAPKGKGGLIALIVILVAILGLGGFLVFYLLAGPDDGLGSIIPFGEGSGSEEHSYYGAWTGTLDGDLLFVKFDQDGTITIAAPDYSEYIVTQYRASVSDDTFTVQVFDQFWEEWEEVMVIEPIGSDRLRVFDVWSEDRYDFRKLSEQEFQAVLSGLTRVEF